MNQPMFQYSQENGFSTMNYILAGVCVLMMLNPTDVMLKERQMRREMKSFVEEEQVTGEDNDGYDLNEKNRDSAEF